MARKTLLVVSAMLMMAAAARATEPLDVKGIYIGMPKEELLAKFPTWDGFTIAGIESKFKHTPLKYEFHDGKVDVLVFFFDPKDFSTMLDAVRGKYPQLQCQTSTVGNAMGAQFPQVECALSDQTARLQLIRLQSLRTSVLMLSSKRFLEELERKGREKKKDI